MIILGVLGVAELLEEGGGGPHVGEKGPSIFLGGMPANRKREEGDHDQNQTVLISGGGGGKRRAFIL